MEFQPIVRCDYGPLDPKVDLLPDFFTGFNYHKRQEIVSKEAEFYKSITAPYSVDNKINKKYLTFRSFDGADIKGKLYMPKKTEAKIPVLVFIHGGGWKTCSVETHDYVPSYIAANAGIAVLSVEYRLAPEYRYPVGLKDCYEAVKFIAKEGEKYSIDGKKIYVGGDSSGGNFAIALCLMAKKTDEVKIKKQVLIYPATDLSGSVEKHSAKVYTPVGTADGKSTPSFFEQYASFEDDPKDPYISPLFAPDVKNLPKALFIQAECDALLDDGLMYAKKLKDAGNDVECHVYKGMPHAFILRTYEETFQALDTICDFLK